MRVDRKWTILHIRELRVDSDTSFQFTLNDDFLDKTENISLDTLHRRMARFRANQMLEAELCEYITSLVPLTICKRLQALGRNRLYLGIKTVRDLNVEHPFPFHAIPWEAAYANGNDGKTWAVAYSAVRIADGIPIINPHRPEHIGLFCCEYNPPLARRDALRTVLENAAKCELSEVREITGSTAADDFLELQRHPVFYASCHGERLENGSGSGAIGLVKPGYAEGEDRFFLQIEPGEGRLSCAGQFADTPPAVYCLDACFSANDPRVPEYLIGRGCNVFIGNAFEAVQDNLNNGTPAVREILSQILTETYGGRKGIGSCVSAGRHYAGNASIYHTLVYVSSRLAPNKDAFGFESAIELPGWFMLVLLAAVSLFVSIVIGRALVFRFLLTHASVFVRLMCTLGIGAVLFLIGLPTVPKDAWKY